MTICRKKGLSSPAFTASLGVLAIVATLWIGPPFANAVKTRIKDISELEGARGNEVAGIGLVVGLNGTGGKMLGTQKLAANMLQRFRIAMNGQEYKSGNVSMVVVTANLGPFNRQGSRIDVSVSALDDATSLQGGRLLMTPLRGADDAIYVTAAGSLTIGGFAVGSANGATPTAAAVKNHPTAGQIPSGGTVEIEARGRVVCNGVIRLHIRTPDPRTARNVASAINDRFFGAAFAIDSATVQVFLPASFLHDWVGFVAEIGSLEVETDQAARVVIDEKTGTVIAGHSVKIASVSIASGGLTVVSNNDLSVSQPPPLSKGATVVVPKAQLGVNEQGGPLRLWPEMMTAGDLARAMNELGASPRDMVNLFRLLHTHGALRAEIVTP